MFLEIHDPSSEREICRKYRACTFSSTRVFKEKIGDLSPTWVPAYGNVFAHVDPETGTNERLHFPPRKKQEEVPPSQSKTLKKVGSPPVLVTAAA
jgi:hypothetical protein